MIRRRLLPLPLLGLCLGCAVGVSAPAAGAPPRSVPRAGRPNFLVLVLDDVGTDLLSSFSAPPGSAACTPSIDFLASRGRSFVNAWSDPVCSPTRAQLLTGRHGFRTGVGTFVNGVDPDHYVGLPQSEVTLAELLSTFGYTTAFFGKWHLATGNLDPADPLSQGFGWFEGSIAGHLGSVAPCPTCPPGCREGALGYYRWVRSVNGVESCDTRYATTATTADSLEVVTGGAMPEPWFVVASYNAIHDPYHVPPAALCGGNPQCVCSGELPTRERQGKAALEAADHELRRLVAKIRESSQGPLFVILLADNGTAAPLAQGEPGACFDPARSKGTVYEAGVRVPLLVWGPGVQPGTTDALVEVTDLFATIAELADVPGSAEDSISLVPYLEGFTGSLRSSIYAETFVPNGLPFTPTDHRRAIRDARYKLIRRTGSGDELYDLVNDPCETSNLYPPPPGSAAEEAWERLDAELDSMGVG